MSKMIRILKSEDPESRQRQLARLKNHIDILTKEAQYIEMSLDDLPEYKKATTK